MSELHELKQELDNHIMVHKRDYEKMMNDMKVMSEKITEMHDVFTGLNFSARLLKWMVGILLSIGSLYLMFKGIVK